MEFLPTPEFELFVVEFLATLELELFMVEIFLPTPRVGIIHGGIFTNTRVEIIRDVGCDRMATPLGTNGLSFPFCLSIAIMFFMLCLFGYRF